MENLKQIQYIITEQNPWWETNSVPDYLAPPTKRPLGKHLWKYILSSRLKRHLIILGPRRVGKTTVMYQTVQHLLKNQIPSEKIQWIRLDHPMLMTSNLGSIVKEAIKLAKAKREKPLYLFLDELVYAEKWDLWLKTFYDEHWPVRIIASSSAAAALQKGKESGVGRWEEFHLTPYLLTELLQLYQKDIQLPIDKRQKHLHSTIENLAKSSPHTRFNFEKERRKLIVFGGFPEFLVSNIKQEEKFLKNHFVKKYMDNRETENFLWDIDNDGDLQNKIQSLLRADAIERAIYKDIPQSYRIDYPITLEKFFYILAGQITGLLSLKGISKDISQVSLQTLERYLNYLVQTYLLFIIPNYDSNERNVQRRRRKIYFVDVAIRNAALLKDMRGIFHDPSELGKLQENLVASHLYHLGKQSGIRLYHWRRGKHEVDFIYDDPVHPLAFEIGTSKRHSLSGLKFFLRENPKFHKRCYYVAPGLHFSSAEDSSLGIGELPLDLLLFATGLQQNQAISLLLGK